MAKAYTEARQHHGESELLDEVVSTKPEVDRTRTGLAWRSSRSTTSQNLREAVAVLEAKAEPEEVEEYKRFILGLSERVAPRPTARASWGSAASGSATPSRPQSDEIAADAALLGDRRPRRRPEQRPCSP